MQRDNAVAVFWDFETTPAPAHISGYQLSRALREVADSYGLIKSFRAYLDVVNQSGPVFTSMRRELHSSGVSLVDCPSHSRKDVADKAIIVDMLTMVMDNPPPYTIVLVTGDRGLSYALAILRLRRYKVVVVSPRGTHENLCMQADDSVDWNSRILGIDRDDISSSSSSNSGSRPASPLPEPVPLRGDRGSQSTNMYTGGPDTILVRPTGRSSSLQPTGDRRRESNGEPGLANDRSGAHFRHEDGRPLAGATSSSSNPPNEIPPMESAPHRSRSIPVNTPARQFSPTESVPRSLPSQTPAVEPGLIRPRAATLSGASLFPPPPAFPLELVGDARGLAGNKQESTDRNTISPKSSSSGFSVISQPTNFPKPTDSSDNRVSGTSPPVPTGENPSAIPTAIPEPARTTTQSFPSSDALISTGSSGAADAKATAPPSTSGTNPPQTPFAGSATLGRVPPADSNPSKPNPPFIFAGTAPATKMTGATPTPTSGPSKPISSPQKPTPAPSKPTPAPSRTTSMTASVPSQATARVLPAKYHILVKQLQQHYREGRRVASSSRVASEIIRLDPNIYRNMGMKKFRPYAQKASRDGIIDLGEDWVSLKPKWLDYVFP